MVGIVVLNWEGWGETLECLRSLDRLEYPRPRILVVDNGSRDDSVERLRAVYKDLWVIETGRNLGFAGGCNVGIQALLGSGADYVWILNNDVTVDPHALSAMLQFAEDNSAIGIIGSVERDARNPARVRMHAGGTFSPWFATIGLPVKAQGRGRHFISGASMLLRREVLEDVDGFDETFFFYMEDVDLAYRAAAAGWGCAVAPRSVIYHIGGASIDRGSNGRALRTDRLQAEGSGILIGKHSGRRMIVAVPVRITGIVLRRMWRRQFRRIPVVVSAFMHGVRTGMRGRGGIVVRGAAQPSEHLR